MTVVSETELSPRAQVAAGKAFREKVPHPSHGKLKLPARRDPLGILGQSDSERLPELVPIRYGRMMQSPFAFFRGSAAVMAADLSSTPASGLKVQACGDCHIKNFGGFATPERNIVFDINDFDETLPAPWEWDVKRLTTSFVLAVRENGISDTIGREVAASCVRAYRKGIRALSKLDPLAVWYMKLTAEEFLASAPGTIRDRVARRIEKGRAKGGSDVDYPKLAEAVHGKIRIKESPPLIYHPDQARTPEFESVVERVLAEYRGTLADDRRILLDRYHFVDTAIKVVGIGSVGTRCWIALFMSPANEPLFLQIKQANASVLEPNAGKSVYSHHGQRVVMGQRLMQAASDIFLGWTTGQTGEYYVRQLRDVKISPNLLLFDVAIFRMYAKVCGWALARAHAKSGDLNALTGYLGKSDGFDKAVADFAVAYADQAERDYDALKDAVKSGKIDAYVE
ncbi:MAG TPA: DUF2252 domain-containing protein [Candidatus Cybelea sp.]|jgi:hypothetical protein